jgi:hypothetical protein
MFALPKCRPEPAKSRWIKEMTRPAQKFSAKASRPVLQAALTRGLDLGSPTWTVKYYAHPAAHLIAVCVRRDAHLKKA